MKKGIHPEYRKVVFMDINTQAQFMIGSTIKTDKTITLEDGTVMPLVNLDISSTSHPFYTGKQRETRVEGQIAKFNRKFNAKQ
ncbi:type B 50S ribosomal protein L31 [Erysipelothrix rhusiopathiae]|uniref:type B 50S ribosomal protein L31 n=2 Tax=Erysipelothrix rhusiopathiae TaxID=1648 RepID=UPI000F438956|nr:type B 50S ribosomal protein L31 [Erysipelothrix rhusiopathiae]AYV34418.1 type B 50S ribosomal protein L31 [Erysipelothrix rhusiopathiae]MDE8081667.1 type B 50S ribosomal protein L31 [Erysipelothrix rhusiopathiae]MDE8314938.1 type B 50S ribosomal protein L31 [Erysipelothrix rhusiopathiae]MDE8329249.1 type B 50S ribosomal protein L31 [Erysipelothrix rhusiopathiae]MDE8332449.1 type B 50S ribosomal protein L31 [Erysipelothrix rhusiopathiae]